MEIFTTNFIRIPTSTFVVGFMRQETAALARAYLGITSGGGSGTVTNTGALTANQIVVGNGGVDVKSLAGPADATKFLNGAATPAFASVKDSDLSLSNTTANNVSIARHGFAPILPNDASKYLDGTGAYSTPPGGSGTVTNTGTLTDHGLIVGNGGVDVSAIAVGTSNTVLHGNTGADPSFSAVVEADISLSNNTTNDVSITKHGFAPIAPNDANKYLDGTGNYSIPSAVAPAAFYFWQEFQGLPNGVNSSAIPGVGINLGSVGSGTVGNYRQGTSTHTPESPYTTASSINSTTGMTAVTGAFGIFPYARESEFVAWATMNETADFAYWIGLTSAAISAVSATQTIPCALFRLGINGIWTDTNWQVFVHNGSSSETIDTGVAYSSTASVKFEIRWDGTTTGKLKFYINSTLVATSTIDLTSSQGLGPLIQVATRANPGTKTLYVGGFKGRVKYY